MKKQLKSILKQIPILSDFIMKRRHAARFQAEIALINKQSTSNSSLPSILHFSINKAATQYVKQVLREISTENDLTPIGIHDYAFASDMPFLDHLSFEEMEQYKYLFKPNGYLYSVFGGMIQNIDDFDNYKIILSIRDPRDILVSDYFSIKYSHPAPPKSGDKRKAFLEKRAAVQNLEINDYVLKESDRVFNILDKYKKNLLAQQQNVAIVKYEDMISDYDKWLLALSKHAGLAISDKLKTKLSNSFHQNKVKKEDKNKERRKGVAGDYKEKLTPETIASLNLKFGELLRFYEYAP